MMIREVKELSLNVHRICEYCHNYWRHECSEYGLYFGRGSDNDNALFRAAEKCEHWRYGTAPKSLSQSVKESEEEAKREKWVGRLKAVSETKSFMIIKKGDEFIEFKINEL